MRLISWFRELQPQALLEAQDRPRVGSAKEALTLENGDWLPSWLPAEPQTPPMNCRPAALPLVINK